MSVCATVTAAPVHLSQVGKRTPVAVRFSTVGGEKGSPDAARDPRGFAIKHYTEEGVWDMTGTKPLVAIDRCLKRCHTGNNTPVFFIRDPQLFPPFIHTQKRHPQTNLPDADMFWDLYDISRSCVCLCTDGAPQPHAGARVCSPGDGANVRPRNSGHLPPYEWVSFVSRASASVCFLPCDRYSSHTFRMVNASNEAFYVKFHYKTDAGIKNLSGPEAAEVSIALPLSRAESKRCTDAQEGSRPCYSRPL